jgi:sugar lactone lactonase YvrE
MSAVRYNSIVRPITGCLLTVVLTLGLSAIGSSAFGEARDKQRKKDNGAATDPASPYRDKRKFWEGLDLSRIVWPNPPAITRIRYVNYWSGEKFVEKKFEKKKSSWMERLSGVATGETVDTRPRWQLVVPNGIAVDSKGLAYIADSKVRAIFIVNTDTGAYQMIKNGSGAHFQWLTGLAIDESDRLFASDSGLHHVLILDPNHKVESLITEGLYDPGGLAIDNENRLLYVSDAEQDLVLVYDADPPYKLLRKIGKPGTKHTSTEPGEFAKPTGVAVDQEGNLYVADTWNNRVEVFDADGEFIRSFGKPGDGPGYFARPKGIAIDSDNHVWVADAVQNRVQVFTPEGQLLIWMGGFGMLPGQFQSLVNLTIDKNNRVYTTEQLAGRMQIFQYTNNAQAKAEKERRDLEAKKKADERRGAKTDAGDAKAESPVNK